MTDHDPSPVTTAGELTGLPGWCRTHDDFAWRYADGSASCFYVCLVEASGRDCKVVPAVLKVRGKSVKQW